MNELLIYNTRVYNHNDCNLVAINDGKISLLENSDNLSLGTISDLKNNSKSILDANTKWLTPGLIDCHTHLVFAGNRSHEFSARLNGKTYQEITKQGGGINSTVLATRQASLEELILLAEKRIKQVIANGVTTLEIKSGYGLNLDSEKKILQVAKYLEQKYPITIQKTFLGAHIVPNMDYSLDNLNRADEYIAYLSDSVLPDLVKNGLVDAVDSFCENIAFSPLQLQPLYQKAVKFGLKIKGHTEQLSNIGGAKLVANYGGLSCDHLEYADDQVVKILKENNITAVLLPGAYYYLNETQKPPIELLRELSVPMAVATDFNPGTSPIISLPTIMNMACVLYKLTPQEVWQAVTINAAKALGLEQNIGSIELGKQADLVLWDFEHPYDLCYYVDYNFDKTIIKNGKIISI